MSQVEAVQQPDRHRERPAERAARDALAREAAEGRTRARVPAPADAAAPGRADDGSRHPQQTGGADVRPRSAGRARRDDPSHYARPRRGRATRRSDRHPAPGSPRGRRHAGGARRAPRRRNARGRLHDGYRTAARRGRRHEWGDRSVVANVGAQLGLAYAFVERATALPKRYWALEIGWLVDRIVTSLSVAYIALGAPAITGGGLSQAHGARC